VAEELSEDTTQIVLDRPTAATVVAGTLISEGDDDDGSAYKTYPGIPAWLGNATHRQVVYNIDRLVPSNNFMVTPTMDMSSGVNCGQFNPALIAQGMVNASFKNRGRIKGLLCHPGMLVDSQFGDMVDAAFTIEGPQGQRRYRQSGGFEAGGLYTRIAIGPFGTADLVPLWSLPENSIFGVDPSTLEYWQQPGGVRRLDEMEKGLRLAFHHTYDKGWYRRCTLVCNAPNKNYRWDNVAQRLGVM